MLWKFWPCILTDEINLATDHSYLAQTGLTCRSEVSERTAWSTGCDPARGGLSQGSRSWPQNTFWFCGSARLVNAINISKHSLSSRIFIALPSTNQPEVLRIVEIPGGGVALNAATLRAFQHRQVPEGRWQRLWETEKTLQFLST